MNKVKNITSVGAKKLKSIFPKPIFWFCLVFMVYNFFTTKQIFENIGRADVLVLETVGFLVEIVIIIGLYFMNKRGLKVENKFLFLVFFLGLMFIVLLPPGQSPDDETHFRRAYAISQGDFVPESNSEDGNVFVNLPVEEQFLNKVPEENTYKKIYDNFGVNTGELYEQKYTTAALYNFVCYLPQTVAIWISRAFNFSLIATEYLVEIINFCVCMGLVYYAIKIIPRFKNILVFLALLPIVLQEATSMSPDALTIGMSFFMVAYVLHIAYSNIGSQMKKREIISLYIIAVIMSLCKIVYLPLVFLYLIIPAEKFGSKKNKWIHLIAIIILVVALNFCWLLISSKYLVEIKAGVDSKNQLISIIKDPMGYIGTIFNAINENIMFWLRGMLGTSLGAFVFNLPDVITLMTLAMMIVLFAQGGDHLDVKKRDKTICLVIFLVIFVLILTSLYLQWNVVGANTISGVQGRYFIPILTLLSIAACVSEKKKLRRTLLTEKPILYYAVFVNILALATIFSQNI